MTDITPLSFTESLRAPTNDALRPKESLIRVGLQLADNAGQLIDQTFDIAYTTWSTKQRDEHLNNLRRDTVNRVFKPEELDSPIVLRQGKKAISAQREHHADTVLRHALFIAEQWKESMTSFHRAGDPEDLSGLMHALQITQSAFLTSQRHLAALEILTNLEDKHYGVRGQRGGHLASRPASKKEQRALLEAMIKGMIYQDLDARKRLKKNSEDFIDQTTRAIADINKKYPFIDIGKLDDLNNEIRNVLVDSKHIKKLDLSQPTIRRPKFHPEDEQIKANLAYERGVLKGGQDVLVYLMKKRFTTLPEEAKEPIDSVSRFEDLQPYVDRLPEAESWEDVLGKSD